MSLLSARRFTPLAAAVAMLLVPAPGMQAQSAPTPPLLATLQAELQRSFAVLSREATPAYFIGYTVHDEHTAQIAASFGALDRSDVSRGRFGTVEVRVGDYGFDNTHPIRGEAGGGGPRVGRISLPLTDDDKPIQLAFWRTTDRAFKLATETLTRARTNAAA